MERESTKKRLKFNDFKKHSTFLTLIIVRHLLSSNAENVFRIRDFETPDGRSNTHLQLRICKLKTAAQTIGELLTTIWASI